jgi:hypothetical protein
MTVDIQKAEAAPSTARPPITSAPATGQLIQDLVRIFYVLNIYVQFIHPIKQPLSINIGKSLLNPLNYQSVYNLHPQL